MALASAIAASVLVLSTVSTGASHPAAATAVPPPAQKSSPQAGGTKKEALESALDSVKHLQKATGFMKEGRYAQAEAELLAADALTPDYCNILQPLSTAQLKQGKSKEALATLERAIKKGKAFDDRVYLLAARIFSESKSYASGEKTLITWAGGRPLTPNFHAAIGILRLGAYELASAEVEFRAALKTDPANEASLTGMSQLYGHFAAYPRLQKFLDAAVTAKPDSVPVLMLTGNNQLRQEHFSEAKEKFEKVLRIDPGSAAAYVNLGSAIHGLGDEEGAIRNFRKAMELDPRNTEAPVNLALSLEAKGQSREALDVLLAARARGVDNLDILNALSLAYHVNGRDKEALAVAKQSLARAGNQPGVVKFIERIESGKNDLVSEEPPKSRSK